MYDYDPSVGLTIAQQALLLGGEVAMWGEKVRWWSVVVGDDGGGRWCVILQHSVLLLLLLLLLLVLSDFIFACLM
jgi:hypothetical protein